MAVFTPYFTQTSVYNSCMLALPASGSVPAMNVPMHLTTLDSVTVNSTLVPWTTGPVLDQPSNTAAGGSTFGLGINELPKLVIAGFIDTPSVVTTIAGQPYRVPNVIVDGLRVTYAEVIAMFYEGRTLTYTNSQSPTPGVYWERVDPLWFRDSTGRVYNTPRLYSFTASLIEGLPTRTNFNMTLQLVGT